MTKIESVRDYLVWRDDALARWLVANGWQMKRSPFEPEEMLAMGHCYINSFDHSHEHGYDYCEGFAASSVVGVPLEHAWCLEPDNGEVIDPTWRHECQDFFGVIIPWDIALEISLITDVYGVLPNLYLLEPDERDKFLAQIAEVNRPFREASLATA